MQLLDDFADIAGARSGVETFGGLTRFTLSPWVHGHDTIVLREMLELLLPDPRRHGPAGNQENRRLLRDTGNRDLALAHGAGRRCPSDVGAACRRHVSRFEVMNLRAIGCLHEAALPV